MKKIYKLTVEPITPIHIGTGNILTPLEYKTVLTKTGNKYLRFSSDSILSRIAADKSLSLEFEKTTQLNDMSKYHEFFDKNCSSDDVLYTCLMTDEFRKKYFENKQKDPTQNAAQVYEIFRDTNSPHPVIPGSSLKGSIRTAVLQGLLNQITDAEYNKLEDEFNSLKDNQKKSFDAKLQKKILNNFENKDSAKTDPFRAVEIADCKFDGRNGQIVGLVKNISTLKNGELKAMEKLQIQVEAILGSIIGSDKISESVLRINEKLQNLNGVSRRITADTIINFCNEFYIKQFEDEYEYFYKNAYDKVDLISKLRIILSNSIKEKNTFIVRVGRLSQLEFVPMEENFRAYWDSKNKCLKQKGDTRTVFDYDGQYIPLGWCKCKVEEVSN